MMGAQTLVLLGQGQRGKRWLFTWKMLFPILFLTQGIVLNMASGTSYECGRPTITQRVVGGVSTYLGKAPWMVSFRYKDVHVCGACLVSRTTVATAAHCARAKDPAQMSVVVGALNLSDPTNSSREIVGVESVVLHPKFKRDGSSGDIAVMKLITPINLTITVLPICLPAPNQHFPDGTMCSLTGWGDIAQKVKLPEPRTLQEVDLPVINAPACNKMFRDKYGELYTSDTIKDDMICAGYTNESKDACQGDSGGPLACKVGDTWLLAGIVSWGIDCATPGIPGVYTKVSSFTSWILEKDNLAQVFSNKTPENNSNQTTRTFTLIKNTTTTSMLKPQNTTSGSNLASSVPMNPQNTTSGANLASSVPTNPQNTTSGANLASSMSLNLLIMSFIITQIRDILPRVV